MSRLLRVAIHALLLALLLPALGESPVAPQDKVDDMFLSPEREPFSLVTLYGSREAFDAVAEPESVEVYRIDASVSFTPRPKIKTILGHEILAGPVALSRAATADLGKFFAARDTFGQRPACGGSPGVLVRAARGKAVVDLLFCFECYDVAIYRNDSRDSNFSDTHEYIRVGMERPAREKFLTFFQGLFPKDTVLQSLKLD
jgi:hypothetical protein